MKDRRKFVINEAAQLLRNDIVEMITQAPDLPWPSTPETLCCGARQPTQSVKEFFTKVIHASNHTQGEDVQCYVNSFSQDLVHAVSRGNFFTEKHILLGTGLHSLTGLKTPIPLFGRFGHSCNYDKVRLIETAEADLAQTLRELEKPLPVLPADETDKVLTFFWWENFDIKKDNSVGSLHTTHGVAYQEKSTNNISIPVNISIEKSKRKTISLQPLELPTRKILPHKNPPSFEDSGVTEINQ
eukprot:Seg2686.1 transcript_id=Seg2686.1/GoldUCD/mRNA.D3Y31 product="hypothetical protein" protein_id=Seg2686.1/GoldUCD/D3Y31